MPKGPAPVRAHSGPSLVVNARHPSASDENQGTMDRPLKSIGAAVKQAVAGDVIQVHAGIYRESIVAETPGTADAPIVLEGVRDADGSMPRISGNVAAPKDAWKPVEGHAGIWRTDNWSDRLANVALAGRLMRERTIVAELDDGEYCLNHAHRELAFPRLSGDVSPQPGASQLGAKWRTQRVDDKGYLDLGDQRGVFYLSTWVWKEPGEKKEVWDPRFPQLITGDLKIDGVPFGHFFDV